jgi:phosphoglucosamine mutase
VDDRGEIVTGDHILYVCANYLAELGELSEKTVVATVMSNYGLFQSLKACGIRCDKTAVGDRYVYEHMAAHGLSLGGEQSGHIIFAKHATTGDGILTALKLMEVMLAKKKKMSELIASFHFYPQELRSLPVCDKHKAATAPEVLAAVEQACGALEGKGRALLRPSGTEDVLRLMVEAPDAQTCHAHAHAIENVLRREGYMR